MVGAGPAAVVNPVHEGMPVWPPELELLLAPELLVEPEVLVVLELLAELELLVAPPPAAELELVAPPGAPPAPPVDDAGSLELPHRAVARQQAAARICTVKAWTRVVRIMFLKLLVIASSGQVGWERTLGVAHHDSPDARCLAAARLGHPRDGIQPLKPDVLVIVKWYDHFLFRAFVAPGDRHPDASHNSRRRRSVDRWPLDGYMTTGSNFGASRWLTAKAMRYAEAHMAKSSEYPAVTFPAASARSMRLPV